MPASLTQGNSPSVHAALASPRGSSVGLIGVMCLSRPYIPWFKMQVCKGLMEKCRHSLWVAEYWDPEDVPISAPTTCGYDTLLGQRDLAGVLRLRALTWESSPDHPGEP